MGTREWPLCNGDVASKPTRPSVPKLKSRGPFFQRAPSRMSGARMSRREHVRRPASATTAGVIRRPISARYPLRLTNIDHAGASPKVFFPKWLTLRVEDICARFMGEHGFSSSERKTRGRRRKTTEEGVFADTI